MDYEIRKFIGAVERHLWRQNGGLCARPITNDTPVNGSFFAVEADAYIASGVTLSQWALIEPHCEV